MLSLNDKEAKEIMTPIKDCLILSSDKILDHEAIDQILLSGFSRIPIHEPGQRDNFIGMLLVKRVSGPPACAQDSLTRSLSPTAQKTSGRYPSSRSSRFLKRVPISTASKPWTTSRPVGLIYS